MRRFGGEGWEGEEGWDWLGRRGMRLELARLGYARKDEASVCTEE